MSSHDGGGGGAAAGHYPCQAIGLGLVAGRRHIEAYGETVFKDDPEAPRTPTDGHYH